jgi:hypothetical protein
VQQRLQQADHVESRRMAKGRDKMAAGDEVEE